jgi:SAM-dependent methyltransferase
MQIEPAIVGYYAGGHEHDRLTARPTLELIRTQVLLRRILPSAPSRVLDVGGANGVYASWLTGRGYEVELVDPMPLHVEQASAIGGFSARLGDARQLEEADNSYDATLLLGPLYHLTDRDDRVRALTEARRVTRPGGVVAGAAISRYASAFDGIFRGFIDRPGFAGMMTEDLRSGQHRNPGEVPEFFPTAYFHDRDALASEVIDAGLSLDDVVPVEGPFHWAPGISERLADPEQLELILGVLTAIEADPGMANATAHLLAVGRVV